MTFRERLNRVLSGRALTVWGRENQLSGGTISRISQGKIPGHKILNLIQKIENVSIGWLVDGVGSPFLLSDEFPTGEYAVYLQEWLDLGGAQAYVITDKIETTVILVQPAEHEYKRNLVPYSALEITHGELTNAELDVIANYPEIYYKTVTSEEIAHVKNGELGTFKLLGDQNHAGLLTHSECITELNMSDIKPRHQINEQPAVYIDKQSVMDRFEMLDSHNQESVSMIIDVLIAKQG